MDWTTNNESDSERDAPTAVPAPEISDEATPPPPVTSSTRPSPRTT